MRAREQDGQLRVGSNGGEKRACLSRCQQHSQHIPFSVRVARAHHGREAGFHVAVYRQWCPVDLFYGRKRVRDLDVPRRGCCPSVDPRAPHATSCHVHTALSVRRLLGEHSGTTTASSPRARHDSATHCRQQPMSCPGTASGAAGWEAASRTRTDWVHRASASHCCRSDGSQQLASTNS